MSYRCRARRTRTPGTLRGNRNGRIAARRAECRWGPEPNGRPPMSGWRCQRSLDFAGFEPNATDLDLFVDPPEIGEGVGIDEPHEVARSVETFTVEVGRSWFSLAVVAPIWGLRRSGRPRTWSVCSRSQPPATPIGTRLSFGTHDPQCHPRGGSPDRNLGASSGVDEHRSRGSCIRRRLRSARTR